jgi:hypothetical protein
VRASRTATRAGPVADGSWAAALPRGAGRLVHDPFGAILKTAFAAGDGTPHFDRRHRHEGVGYRHHRQERYEERRHAPSSPSPPTCPRSIDVREGQGPRRGPWPHGAPQARKLPSGAPLVKRAYRASALGTAFRTRRRSRVEVSIEPPPRESGLYKGFLRRKVGTWGCHANLRVFARLRVPSQPPRPSPTRFAW